MISTINNTTYKTIKKNRILISIIMNCYNGEKYLNETINSVLLQTYQDWELIFWDNQSTDTSAKIVKSYNDKRIKYFYAKKHTNLGEARNLAFKKSKGKWVGFLDVDDIWYPQKLEFQINKIYKLNVEIGFIYGRCKFFNQSEDGVDKIKKSRIRPTGKLPEENLHNQLYLGNLIPFTSVLFSINALKNISDIKPYKFAPDYFLVLAISHNFRIIAITETICAYRIHNQAMSKKFKEIGYKECVDIINSVSTKKDKKVLNCYYKVRLMIFYLMNLKLVEVKNIFLEIGVLNFLRGFLGLMIFTIRYNNKLGYLK